MSLIKINEYDKTEEEINTLIITVYSAVLIRAYDDFSLLLSPVVHPFLTSDLTG
jgi:hypothetical protein